MLTQSPPAQWLHGAVTLATNLLFPPRCPSCHGYVAAEGNFCAACFSSLRLIEEPCCACCGVPFSFPTEVETRCPTCLVTPPDYDHARAALVYDATSAPLIGALKFNDQWANLERYGSLMQRAGGAMLEGADLLVPVPLHWRRLLRRKFNQSALLAFALSKRTGIPCLPHMLQRVRYTKPQMRMKREERLKNVKRAFAVSPEAEKMLRNKIVVLIDDVVTTGATVNACAIALKQAGAREVRVLALAKTVLE